MLMGCDLELCCSAVASRFLVHKNSQTKHLGTLCSALRIPLGRLQTERCILRGVTETSIANLQHMYFPLLLIDNI